MIADLSRRSLSEAGLKDIKNIDVRDVGGGTVIPVKVVPGSSRDRIAGVLGDCLKITTSQPAEKGKANKGIAALKVTPKGPEFVQTGNSPIQQQRPLYVQDGRFYEEETGKLLSLEQILKEYLNTVPQVIADFQILRAG